MDATKYHPQDDHNFLRDWSNSNCPRGWENKPLTWISLEDARAYAKCAGKWLPPEWEWQLAAQGTDGRSYPWGDKWDSKMIPATDRSHEATGPDNVDAHQQGKSPFGWKIW
jgi:formylglycine-generating enzyme required for sulfatase activity